MPLRRPAPDRRGKIDRLTIAIDRAVRVQCKGGNGGVQKKYKILKYEVPPPVGDPHWYQDSNGEVYYLDDQGFIGGHSHSWAEAVRAAAKLIDFSEFDRNGDGELSPDECLVVIVKAQANTFGTRRPVSGSDVPKTDLKVNGVTIKTICELYAAPPHEPNDLAAAVEEVLHLAANLADQYPDRSELQPRRNYRQIDDPGRPGQLALTDACGQPVHIDPYHKLKWGWLNPQLADHSGRYTLRAAATTGEALILYSPYFGVTENFYVGVSHSRPVPGERRAWRDKEITMIRARCLSFFQVGPQLCP